jgi:hypothetical protein
MTYDRDRHAESAEDLGPIARRIAARKAAEAAAIGRPSVVGSAALTLSPFTRRAIAGRLPAKVVRS